jgi:glycosyltransferase involved in cell wall biosynthesis
VKKTVPLKIRLKSYVSKMGYSWETDIAEILKNGKYGVLFKISDYKKLSKIIVNYSKNKKKYLIMTNQAHKSLQRFNFETNCNKYLKLILKYS